MMTQELSENEFNPYYKRYIDQAVELPLLDGLALGMQETHDFFKAIPTEKWDFRYEEGKWTPKEILLHLIDTERVFAYRALQFARSENVVLKGYDQDEFAMNSNANNRAPESLLEEFITVRAATISQYKSYNQATQQRMGEASDSPLSVRAAGFIICGHERHHIKVLKERYL